MLSFLKQVVTEFGEDDCLTMAASLAYYVVFSLAPLLLVVIAIAGLFVSPAEAEAALHGQFEFLIGADGAEQVRTMLAHVRSAPAGSWLARVLGVVVLLFGATGVMVQLQAALNRTWGVRPDPEVRGGLARFALKRMVSFAMILGIAFLLLVSLVLSAFASALAERAGHLLPEGVSDAALWGLDLSVSFVLVTALFAALYKFLPEARVRWRDVLVGAAVTGVLFVLGKFGIGVYLGQSNVGTVYGAASSLAILFVWVYFSAVILLFGAEFTQVWTHRFGHGIAPRRGTLLVETEERVVGHGPQVEA